MPINQRQYNSILVLSLIAIMLCASQAASAQDLLGQIMRGIQQGAQRPPQDMGPFREPGLPDLAPAEQRLSPRGRGSVQEDLARLGFYAGPRDGAFGSSTRAAVRRFQASVGAPQTGYFSPHQLGQLRRSAEASQRLSQSGVLSPDGGVVARESARTSTAATDVTRQKLGSEDTVIDSPRGGSPRNEFSQAILRRFVKASPTFLDSRDNLKRLLETLAYSTSSVWPTAENLDRQRRVANGTEFEQEAALDEFKAFLSAQATDAPLRILRIRASELGRYDRQKRAFPLNFGNERSGYSDQMILDWRGGPGIKVDAGDWNGIGELPMEEQEAVRFASQLGRNRTVYAAVRLTVSKIAPSEQADGPWMQAIGTVESVAIHRPPTTPGNELGTRIATLSVNRPTTTEPEAPRPTEAANAVESWTRLGARSEGDALVVRYGRNSFTETTPDNQALLRGLVYLALSQSPGIANNLPKVFAISSQLLGPNQHAQLFARRTDYAYFRTLNDDVFRRRDIVDAFKAKHLATMIAQRPQLPVKVRIIAPVVMDPYNLARGSFRIQGIEGQGFSQSNGRLSWPSLGGLFDVRTDLVSFPGEITIDERRARELNDRLRSGGQGTGGFGRFHVTVDLDLLSLAPVYPGEEKDYGHVGEGKLSIQSPGFEARVQKLTFYEDDALTRPLWNVPLDSFRYKAPAVAIDPLPNLDIGKPSRLTLWGAIGLAARSGAEPDFLEQSAKTASAYVNASEFERGTVLTGLRKTAEADTPKPEDPVYLMGSLKLGPHDGRMGFAVESYNLAYARDSMKPQPQDGVLELNVANPEALTSFPIDPAVGQQLIKAVPARTFQALFRVSAQKAKVVPSTKGPKASLSVQVEEIVLLHPRETERAIARVKADAIVAAQGNVPALTNPDDVRLASTPDRVPLNDETMVLFVLSQSGREPDDAALRWLLVRRWKAEHDPYGNGGEHGTGDNGPRNVWGSFFPKGFRALSEQDAVRFTPAFRRWNALRVAALPRKLTFYWHSYNGSPSFGRAIEKHAEILEKIGLSRQLVEEGRYGTLGFRTDQGGRKIFKGGVIEMSHQPALNAAPSAYLRLPDVPAPAIGDHYEVYVDLDVTRLVATDAGTGLPVIAFDTSATEVRWWGDKTAVTPRQLVATLKTEPTAPLPEIRHTEPDIVGLKIGMSLAEAEAAVSSQMNVGRVLERVGAVEGGSTLATVTRLYVRDDGMELISALFAPEPLGGKLLGARRDIYIDKTKATLPAIQAKLQEKYGPLVRPDVMSWGSTADLPGCGTVISAIDHPWLEANLVRGEPVGPKFVAMDLLARNAEAAAALRTTRRIWAVQWTFVMPAADHGHCGTTVKAEFSPSRSLGFAGERIPDDEAALLTTWLVNHKVHAEAVKVGRDKAEQERKSGTATKPLPDVKL